MTSSQVGDIALGLLRLHPGRRRVRRAVRDLHVPGPGRRRHRVRRRRPRPEREHHAPSTSARSTTPRTGTDEHRSPIAEDALAHLHGRRLRLQRSTVRPPTASSRSRSRCHRGPAARRSTAARVSAATRSSARPTSPPASWSSRRRRTPTARATRPSRSGSRTTAAPTTAAWTSTRPRTPSPST